MSDKSDVYFKRIDSKTTVEEVQKITQRLLDKIIKEKDITLEDDIPLKVHFGEAGNETYVRPEYYDGIIDFLESRGKRSEFIETLVVYGGRRNTKDSHIELAKEHGFTRLPIVIADGDHGEKFSEIEIDMGHYKRCRIGKEFENYKQVIVLSHFKGHALAGFGGSIKQLSMGHAAKGGKLEMHMGIKPQIINRKCVKCGMCRKACNENAITIDKDKSFIDHDKCVGCGGCVAICPQKAISLFSIKGIYRTLFQRDIFREKLVEYAYAAQKGKNNIYFNFAMNITAGCDCERKKMTPLMEDFGIFVSTDPVAIDKACYDMAKKRGKAFKGHDQLLYAEKIGLGTTKYNLIEI